MKSKKSFQEAADNIAYNYGQEYPEYVAVRNKMSEVDIDISKLKESETILRETEQIKIVNIHSEGSKCYLLLMRIALARGQLGVAS